MPSLHAIPYATFRYLVSFAGKPGDLTAGGFSTASGLEAGRLRNARGVVLQRGRIAPDDFFGWVKASRYGVAEPRQVTITVLDAPRGRWAAYILRNARPARWTGPALAAKGGGDVAMEELELAHEGIELE